MTSATQILSLTFNRRRGVNSQPQMGTHHANFVTTKKCNAIIHYITPTRVCQDGKRCLLFKNSLIFFSAVGSVFKNHAGLGDMMHFS